MAATAPVAPGPRIRRGQIFQADQWPAASCAANVVGHGELTLRASRPIMSTPRWGWTADRLSVGWAEVQGEDAASPHAMGRPCDGSRRTLPPQVIVTTPNRRPG